MKEELIKEIITLINPRAAFLTSGRYIMTNCLFASSHKHKDRKPSAAILINDEGVSHYFCHGCKFSSSLNRALHVYFNVDGVFKQDLREFVLNKDMPDSKVSSEYKDKTLDEMIDDYYSDFPDYEDKTKLLQTLSPLNLDGRQFLATKGITTELGLSYFRQKGNLIYIPYFKKMDEKRFICVGARCRSMQSSPDLPKYFSTKEFAFRSIEIFYGEWAKNLCHRKIFIVEGELDAVHLWQFGLPAIALGGTTWNNNKLVNLLTMIEPESVILSADTDDPGCACNEKIYKSLKNYLPCKIVQFGKDPKYIDQWRLKLWYLKTDL